MGNKSNHPQSLRIEAEAQLCHISETESTRTREELLHELQVHQIELQMQHEELQRSYAVLSKSHDNYIDLYDFSPVGYLTLTHQGLIAEVNLTAAGMLGVDRRDLLNRRFAAFVAPKDADLWYLFLVDVKKNIKRKSIELFLKYSNGNEFPVLLNCVHTTLIDKDFMLRVSLTDIAENKQFGREIHDALKYAENIIETMREPLIVLSSDLRVVTANYSFYKTFKVIPAETVGNFIYDLGNRQWDIPKLRTLLEDILPNATVFNDYEVEHDFLNIGHKAMLLNAREIVREEMGTRIILLAIEDVTERKQLETKTRNALQYSENIIETLREPLIVLSSELKVMSANHSFYVTFKVSPEETIGNFIYDIGNRQWDIPALRILLEDILPNVSAFNDFEVEHDFLNIGPKVLLLNAREIFREKIGSNIILLSMQDITERSRLEKETRISAIAFESQEGIIVTDANNSIIRVNNALTLITGYSAEELIGKNPRVFHSGRHNKGFYAAMWKKIIDSGVWSGEVWNRRKNGQCYPGLLTITAIVDAKGIVTNYISTITDITISQALTEEIKHFAFYDHLTGLPNIRLLRDRLKPTLASSYRSGRKGALLFMDLDNFKILNDSMGHDMGDLLLQQVAERLEYCVREGDTVARLGGDEFVVMLEDLSEQSFEAATQAEVIGNKILDALSQPYQLAMRHYQCSASIGVSLFNDKNHSADQLLKQADIAMYQAKDAGGNTLRFFDPQMQVNIDNRVALEDNLRLAISENQFELFYQPQVNHLRQIIGAEVLIRWRHPHKGYISPADFIPLAEETALILPIGQWVLEAACAQIKSWESNLQAQHLVLAVNVSARQFHQPDFIKQVSQIIKKSSINPKLLKLELTESLVLDDIDDTLLKMHGLREMGVYFSMDDFGTGFSSLAYLTQLPFTQLKIDQSFIHNIDIKQTDAVIVQTIIGMGHNLGMKIIAEGVETQAQRAFLEAHGCMLYQGFLFSKPVPLGQFEALLNQGFKIG